jgi:hypothetical protein
MNWNTADGLGRMPITRAFARRVGMIMTELDEHTEPNPSYRFKRCRRSAHQGTSCTLPDDRFMPA